MTTKELIEWLEEERIVLKKSDKERDYNLYSREVSIINEIIKRLKEPEELNKTKVAKK